MKITIQPSKVSGVVLAPTSKSSMQRACAAALLRNGKSVISNSGQSNDDKAALEIIQRLGATVTRIDEETIEVDSNFLHEPNNSVAEQNEINCGESGLSIRMFTPIAALRNDEIIITGEGSLRKRPLHFFDEILPPLGVKIESQQGKLPLRIKGPLAPTDILIDGSLSSQFLTGLLFAFAAADLKNIKNNIVTITVKGLSSKPYIDLTMKVLEEFGLLVPENNHYEQFIFNYNDKIYKKQFVHYTVEGDWSGAAFLLVSGAIAGAITVRGLSLNSTQADKKIMDALMLANAGLSVDAKGINIRPALMNAFEFDATDCPDLFPPLVALAAYCKGVTILKGVNRLIHKESNRAATLQEEFLKLGVSIEIEEDLMFIHGGYQLNGNLVSSHQDHRIAMACAVAALGAIGNTEIENAEAVNKSYPQFFDDLKQLGAKIKSDIDINLVKEIFKNTQ